MPGWGPAPLPAGPLWCPRRSLGSTARLTLCSRGREGRGVAIVLDTDALPPRERAEAVQAAMRYARVPADLTHDPGGGAGAGPGRALGARRRRVARAPRRQRYHVGPHAAVGPQPRRGAGVAHPARTGPLAVRPGRGRAGRGRRLLAGVPRRPVHPVRVPTPRPLPDVRGRHRHGRAGVADRRRAGGRAPRGPQPAVGHAGAPRRGPGPDRGHPAARPGDEHARRRDGGSSSAPSSPRPPEHRPRPPRACPNCSPPRGCSWTGTSPRPI